MKELWQNEGMAAGGLLGVLPGVYLAGDEWGFNLIAIVLIGALCMVGFAWLAYLNAREILTERKEKAQWNVPASFRKMKAHAVGFYRAGELTIYPALRSRQVKDAFDDTIFLPTEEKSSRWLADYLDE